MMTYDVFDAQILEDFDPDTGSVRHGEDVTTIMGVQSKTPGMSEVMLWTARMSEPDCVHAAPQE